MFRRRERNLRRDVEEKPKFTVFKSIREKGYPSQCSQIGDKNKCRMMAMMGGGTALLQIESRRWRGLHGL
jgi:hypothetical protein